MIKLVVSDVDGTLTDGRFTIDSSGNETKTFNVKDGMGSILLRKNGIKVAFFSGRDSEIVKNRALQLKVDYYVPNCNNKAKEVISLSKKENINLKEIAFIGDDVNDLEIISLVGFSGCPRDAVSEVKNKCDFISKKNGGHGAFREFADFILKNNG